MCFDLALGVDELIDSFFGGFDTPLISLSVNRSLLIEGMASWVLNGFCKLDNESGGVKEM